MGIFMYKVVKTDDFLQGLGPLKNVLPKKNCDAGAATSGALNPICPKIVVVVVVVVF